MATQAEYHAGETVRDNAAEEDVRMVIVDPERGRAEAVFVGARDASVAELNPTVPPDDPVVSCVHEDWLNRHVGDQWKQWKRETFVERLTAFAERWGLQLKTYDYPVSRLRPVHKSPAGGQSSIADW